MMMMLMKKKDKAEKEREQEWIERVDSYFSEVGALVTGDERGTKRK